MLEPLERLDHHLFFILNQGFSTPLLDHALWLVSAVANAGVLILLLGIGLWYVDPQAVKRHLGWMVLAILMGGLAVQLLKYGIARPRPLDTFTPLIQLGKAHIHIVGPRLNHRSFPSGHTQAAASAGLYLTCLYPRRWYAWGAGILLVGLSRVYLGAHFPSDVLAGAFLGGLTAAGAWHLQRRWRARCGKQAA